MEKILVEDWVDISQDIDGLTTEEVYAFLLNLSGQLQVTESIKLKMQYYYDAAEVHAIYKRLETDSEYQNRMMRLELEKKKKLQKEEKERKKYERLKAKFENK